MPSSNFTRQPFGQQPMQGGMPQLQGMGFRPFGNNRFQGMLQGMQNRQQPMMPPWMMGGRPPQTGGPQQPPAQMQPPMPNAMPVPRDMTMSGNGMMLPPGSMGQPPRMPEAAPIANAMPVMGDPLAPPMTGFVRMPYTTSNRGLI